MLFKIPIDRDAVVLPAVLHIARVVIHPLKRQVVASIVYVLAEDGGGQADGVGARVAQGHLVDVYFIEGNGVVLHGATFKELALDLRVVDFGDSDRAVLHEGFIAYLTVEQQVLRDHIFAVDMPEDSQVLRAVFEGKSDGEGVTVCAGEIAVLRYEVKGAVALDGGELVVDKDLH